MDKREREDVIKTGNKPDNIDMKQFIEILDNDKHLIQYLNDKLAKEIIKQKPTFISECNYDIYEDTAFVKELIISNPEVIIDTDIMYEIDMDDEINNIILEYIDGSKKLPETSRLKEGESYLLYKNASEDIKENLEVSKEVIKKDYTMFAEAGYKIRSNEEIVSEVVRKYPKMYIHASLNKNSKLDQELLILYLNEEPHKADKYIEKIKKCGDNELVEKILQSNFKLYEILKEDNLDLHIIQKIHKNIDNLKEVRKEFNLENNNIRYEIFANDNISNMNPNVLSALLEFNTSALDNLIFEEKAGNFNNINNYLNMYLETFGNTMESVHNSINSYKNIKKLYNEMLDKNVILSDEEKNRIQMIISNDNKLHIDSYEQFLSYNEINKSYYDNKVQNVKTIQEMKDIVFNKIFDKNSNEIKNILDSYKLGYDVLEEKIENNEIENLDIDEDISSILTIIDTIQNIEDIDELKKFYNINDDNNLVLELHEVERKLKETFSKVYDDTLLDLNDKEKVKDIQKINLDGIEVYNLKGQSFGMFLHRIYNFDKNMNSNTDRLLEDLSYWNKLEGASYISTSYITEKSIKGVFGELQDGSSGLMPIEDMDKFKEECERRKKELKPIQKDALFIGFGDVQNNIEHMDIDDMMLEHGDRKINPTVSHQNFLPPDELAFFTLGKWNEVAIKRKDTNLDNHKTLMPSYVVCFDNNINEISINASKKLTIPIVNIDREIYKKQNENKLNELKEKFKLDLDKSLIREIMYRTPYENLCDSNSNIEELIGDINDCCNIDKKSKCTYELLKYCKRFHKIGEKYERFGISQENDELQQKIYKIENLNYDRNKDVRRYETHEL